MKVRLRGSYASAIGVALALAASTSAPLARAGAPPERDVRAVAADALDAASGSGGVDTARVEPLALDEVLRSTDAHFPLLAAARAERRARAARLEGAHGAFDLSLSASGDVRADGYYDGYAGEVALDQPTRVLGARLFAGYRYGGGAFPSYEGGRLTNDAGEARAGVRIPVLRDRAIDAARGAVARAEAELARATPEVELEVLAARADAAVAYWDWVAAGHRLRIAQRLLDVAERRQVQIARRVEAGAEPRIHVTDNRRLIVERSGAVRAAERDVARAALALSLFLRDESGRPLRPSAARLPDAFPATAPLTVERARTEVERAAALHPSIRRLEHERAALQVDRDLARNALLPALDVRLDASRDFGGARPGIDAAGRFAADPRGENEVKASVELRLPFQRRDARGRLGAAEAALERLERRLQLERERLVASALAALETLEASHERAVLARENVELAESLWEAERRRLALGASDLIDLTLREAMLASAELELVDAHHAYFRAHAEWVARVARPS